MDIPEKDDRIVILAARCCRVIIGAALVLYALWFVDSILTELYSSAPVL